MGWSLPKALWWIFVAWKMKEQTDGFWVWHRSAVVEEVLGSLTKVKVAIPQGRNTAKTGKVSLLEEMYKLWASNNVKAQKLIIMLPFQNNMISLDIIQSSHQVEQQYKIHKYKHKHLKTIISLFKNLERKQRGWWHWHTLPLYSRARWGLQGKEKWHH